MSISEECNKDNTKAKKITDDFLECIIKLFKSSSKLKEGLFIEENSFLQKHVTEITLQFQLKLPPEHIRKIFSYYKVYLTTGDKKLAENMRNMMKSFEYILLMSVRIRDMIPDDTFMNKLRNNMLLYTTFNCSVSSLYDFEIGWTNKYNIKTILSPLSTQFNSESPIYKKFAQNAADVNVIFALSNLLDNPNISERISENKFDNLCTIIVYSSVLSAITCNKTTNVQHGVEQKDFIKK